MISLYIRCTQALTGMWGCKLNETLQESESMQLLSAAPAQCPLHHQ